MTSEKIKNVIAEQINSEILAGFEHDNFGYMDYDEMLEILIEVSKMEAALKA